MKLFLHKEGCCGHEKHEHHEHNHSCGCHSEHDHEVGKCECEQNKTQTTHEKHGEQCCCEKEEEEEGHSCSSIQESKTKDNTSLDKAKYKFKIENLDCANCAMKVESAILKLDYVDAASLNFSSSLLFVNSKRNDTENLIQDLEKVACAVENGVQIKPYSRSEVKVESHRKEITQLLLSLTLFMIALSTSNSSENTQFWLYLLSYLIAGYHVILTAFKNILKGDMFDENFLMSIATIGAFMLGDYAEAIAVMLFYDVGELFQSIAVNRSRKSIGNLMDIHSDYAFVIRDGEEIQVTPEELQVSDIVRVKAGERIPVDGVVLEGFSSLDVSALTGESLPKEISANDEVLAGCLNINGTFTMKVSKVVSESTVARVLDLVENASSKKAKVEKFITKFSKVYTPMVVLAAVLIVIIPTMIFGFSSFSTWLYRGCIFLVISCPCALVVSIPLGLFAGIGAASKKGILVKGGNYLELLSDVDTIIFDKTGTITKGVFKVQEVIGLKETLEYAAYGESYSNHPIALSILDAYDQKIDESKLSNYEEVAGLGIQVLYENKLLLVGNAKLLEDNNVHFEVSKALGSVVYVAYDSNYVGCLIINDEIKESSKIAMRKLQQLGITKKVMLSGDRNEIASIVGNEVGMDEVHAQLLPQDKVSILETYMNETHKVAFVGDGINDAPVLMRADIGIAMGGIGSDAAIEASDIVLMNDDLSSIPIAIAIARKTKRILYQNITFSLVVKFGVLALTVVGLANMWMGVVADVGVTLLAIMNAMRTMINKQ